MCQNVGTQNQPDAPVLPAPSSSSLVFKNLNLLCNVVQWKMRVGSNLMSQFDVETITSMQLCCTFHQVKEQQDVCKCSFTCHYTCKTCGWGLAPDSSPDTVRTIELRLSSNLLLALSLRPVPQVLSFTTGSLGFRGFIFRGQKPLWFFFFLEVRLLSSFKVG